MGVRGSVTVSCMDHPSGDSWIDKYLGDRGFDPFTRGTFWGKLRARIPSMDGYPLRVLRGTVGQDLADMYTEHYFITSATMDGHGITIQAKDALYFCDAKKAQCPLPSTGRLSSAIGTGVGITVDLLPTGIGDSEYADTETTEGAGWVCLSNKEVVSYTRVADTLTLTGRALFGSTLQEHDEEATAQAVKVFDSQSVADIVYELLVDYTPGIDAAWCNLPAWQAEADSYIGHLYTNVIAAPTEVNKLINELIEQAGVTLWWDPAAQVVQFRSLRPVDAEATLLTEDVVIAESVQAKEQPQLRLSESLTYYGIRDVTNRTDKEPNFAGQVLEVDADANLDYNDLPAYGKVFSRWITIDNRAAAARHNEMKLSRFRDPPREITFALWAARGSIPELGDAVSLRHFLFQDTEGSLEAVPVIITERERREAMAHYTAQEIRFSDGFTPGSDRDVFIDVDRFNLNLRTLYDSLYSSVPYGGTVRFYLSPGAWIGGQVDGQFSLVVGDWDDTAVTLELYVGTAESADANILGRGGYGAGYPGPSTGQDGSGALYTRYPITVYLYGDIGGGGGGGEDAVGTDIPSGTFYTLGGGGGAGFNGYDTSGDRIGAPGGLQGGETGGTALGGDGGADLGHTGGDGGNLGQDGSFAEGGGLGYTSAGVAIDGVSYITFAVASGSIIGDQIN